jgi:hypothetical protein
LGAHQNAPAGARVDVAGVVLDAFGQPVSGARVSLSTTGGARPIAAVETGADGRFTLPGLAADNSYSVAASKAGYSGGFLGQLSPAGTPALPTRARDLAASAIRLRLWKNAVISGRVVDDANEPVVRTTVWALRRIPGGGPSVFTRQGSTTTDDLGAYRIIGLAPGDYLVAVPSASSQRRIGLEPADFPAVFYNQARSASTAIQIPLTSAEERHGVDFVVTAASPLSVSGRVVGLAGDAAPVTVRLRPVDGGAGGAVADIDTQSVLADRDGSFSLRRVPPGHYAVSVLAFPSDPERAQAVQGARTVLVPMAGSLPSVPVGPTWWGETVAVVDTEPLKDVVVPVESGRRIQGAVDFGGRQPRSQGIERLEWAVVVRPLDPPVLGSLPLARIEADGRFTTVGLPPGAYALSPFLRGVERWRLESVSVAGRRLDDGVIRLGRTDVTQVVLTLTDASAEIAGVVRGRDGLARDDAIVYLFPADARLWVSSGPGRFASIGSVLRGAYRVDGLLPGEYYLIAILDGAGDDWRSPAVLHFLASRAVRVRLQDRDSITLDLVAQLRR